MFGPTATITSTMPSSIIFCRISFSLCSAPPAGFALPNLARSPCFLSMLKMPLHELMRLHKHTAGAAGRVVNSTLIRLNDFYNEFYDACRRKKFAPARAIRKRKFTKKVFVDSPESITLNIIRNLIKVFKKRDYGSVIKFLKCLWQNTGKLFILCLNLFHRIIHGSAHIRSFRQFYKIREASFFRNKQHAASMVIGR